MPHDEVLKIKEVAALLKVGEKTVYSMAQAGELPAFKVRGQWRFSRKDMDDWIERQKQTSEANGQRETLGQKDERRISEGPAIHATGRKEEQ